MEDEPNTPWATFDAAIGLAKDAFAVIGIVATLAFLVGYFWSR